MQLAELLLSVNNYLTNTSDENATFHVNFIQVCKLALSAGLIYMYIQKGWIGVKGRVRALGQCLAIRQDLDFELRELWLWRNRSLLCADNGRNAHSDLSCNYNRQQKQEIGKMGEDWGVELFTSSSVH